MSFALHHHPPWQRVWVDDMIGAYVDWREECLAVQAAYERWSSAPPEDEVLAFAAYLAALDSEERASLLYEKLVQRVGEHVGS